MYQLMILNSEGDILGAYSDSNRLPDVREIFLDKDYIGVEVPYNMDLIENYGEYCFRDNQFIKMEPIDYQITKFYISPNEITTIFVPKDTTAAIEDAEYEIDDGVIEYSNSSPGEYKILLMAKGYKNTIVKVEVIEE